jgi:hypothetical protein
MWISLVTYRRDVQREQPLLTANLTPVQEQPGWFQTSLRLEIRSTHGWRCDAIQFMTWGARGITWQDAHSEPNLYGDSQEKNPLPRALAKKRLPLNMEVIRLGDSRTATFFVFVPTWRGKLSMRASLRSIESTERTKNIAITRRLSGH